MAEKQSYPFDVDEYINDLNGELDLEKPIKKAIKDKIKAEFNFLFDGETNIIKYLNSDDFLDHVNGEKQEDKDIDKINAFKEILGKKNDFKEGKGVPNYTKTEAKKSLNGKQKLNDLEVKQYNSYQIEWMIFQIRDSFEVMKQPVDEKKLSSDIRMLLVLEAMYNEFLSLNRQTNKICEDIIKDSSYQKTNDIVKEYIYNAGKAQKIALENLGIKKEQNFNLIDLSYDQIKNIIDAFSLSYNKTTGSFNYLSFYEIKKNFDSLILNSKASAAINHICDLRKKIDDINKILDDSNIESFRKMQTLHSLYSNGVRPLNEIFGIKGIFEINNSETVKKIKQKYEGEKIKFQIDLLKKFGDFDKDLKNHLNIHDTLKCVLDEDVGKLFDTLYTLRSEFDWLKVDPIDGAQRILNALHTEIDKYVKSVPENAFSSEAGAEIKKIIDGLPEIIKAAENDYGKARMVFKFVFDLFCFLIPFVSFFTRENHFENLWHPVSKAKLEKFKQNYKKLLKDIDINKLNIKGQNQKSDLR